MSCKKLVNLKTVWIAMVFSLFPPFYELEALDQGENVAGHTNTAKSILAAQKPGEWEVLFDGKNTAKWKGVNSNTFPSNGWIIEEEALVLANKGGGDIITREKYSNFELELKFKLTRGANSGIKYFVSPMETKKETKTVMNGPEYQIIDDYNHPEVKDHQHEEGATAALYLIYPAQNKKLLPEGQWNQAKIIARGKYVEHWLNGVKVVSYERGNKDFQERVAATKFKAYINYGEVSSGHILLTDHGDKVYFKDIRIKRL